MLQIPTCGLPVTSQGSWALWPHLLYLSFFIYWCYNVVLSWPYRPFWTFLPLLGQVYPRSHFNRLTLKIQPKHHHLLHWRWFIPLLWTPVVPRKAQILCAVYTCLLVYIPFNKLWHLLRHESYCYWLSSNTVSFMKAELTFMECHIPSTWKSTRTHNIMENKISQIRKQKTTKIFP